MATANNVLFGKKYKNLLPRSPSAFVAFGFCRLWLLSPLAYQSSGNPVFIIDLSTLLIALIELRITIMKVDTVTSKRIRNRIDDNKMYGKTRPIT